MSDSNLYLNNRFCSQTFKIIAKSLRYIDYDILNKVFITFYTILYGTKIFQVIPWSTTKDTFYYYVLGEAVCGGSDRVVNNGIEKGGEQGRRPSCEKEFHLVTKYKRNRLSNTNNDCLEGRQNSGLGSLLYNSCKMQ